MKALFIGGSGVISSACVRRAEAYFRDRADQAVRMEDAAMAAGCSVRALQQAFHKFRGTTPHAALTRAFGAYTDRRGYCALGSIKSNLGHATTAAGVTGLIKVLLALKHRRIPPSIHCEQPNPAIRLDESPFFPGWKEKWHAQQGY